MTLFKETPAFLGLTSFSKCKKLCFNDPKDTMIADCASLKAGLAEAMIREDISSGAAWTHLKHK